MRYHGIERTAARFSAKARAQARYEAEAYQVASRWCGRPMDAEELARAYELFLARWLRTLAATAPTAELRVRMALEAEALEA